MGDRGIVSLCSGIGGLEAGLEAVGVGPVLAQVEKDAFCRDVLAKHWPRATRLPDLHDAGRHNLPLGPFVLAAGFPCQPVSLAGKRRAQDDPRWLWPEVARVIEEIRPRYVFLENVPGLLTACGGLAYADVLRDLAALGVDAEWGRFRASDVGAPHKRERWFLLGELADADARGPQGRDEGAERTGRNAARGNGASVADAVRLGHEPDGAGGEFRRAKGAAQADGPEREWCGRGARGGGAEGVADAGREYGDGREDRYTGCESDRETPGREQGPGDDQRSGGAPMVNANVPGLPLREGQPGDAREEQPTALGTGGRSLPECGGRIAQPGVGRDAHGLPGRVDLAPRWPAGRGEAQHPWEPPRTIGKISHRRARLSALGNAVVPQVAALAWVVLWERLTGARWEGGEHG